MRIPRSSAPKSLNLLILLATIAALAISTACGGVAASPPGAGAPNTPPPTTPTPAPANAPTATLTANPTTVPAGQPTTLTWTTTNASTVSIDNGIGTVSASGSKQVTPTQTTTYTLTATGAGGTTTATANVTVGAPQDITAVNHIVIMLQENRSFDNYFGQLGSYKAANNLGAATDIDGLPPGSSNDADGHVSITSFHIRTGCVEQVDPDWLGSHGDFNLNDPGSNNFLGNGYVHNAQGTARTSGLITLGGASGSITVNPDRITNYYLFQSSTAGVENFSSEPIAVVTVTVTGDTKTLSPSAPSISPPAGVVFTATPTTVSPGQAVTLTWSVPGAAETMVNTYFDQLGRRAMGYYDGNDLNYYYFMAANFATSDKWFSPIPSNSPPNRFAFYAATTHGHAHDPGTVDSGVVKNIFQLLDAAGISWKVYFTIDPNLPGVPHTMLTRFKPFADQHAANLVPVAQYFTDLQNGTLAQVSFIEELPGFDEHPGATLAGSIHGGNNVQDGAQLASSYINSFMNSKYWADGVFFLTYDESGGFYDHVPGQPTVSPDGLMPTDLRPEDIQFISPPADFTRTGFRVPLIVVSPFAKKSFVSHTVADFTAIDKFIETRFKLPNLTARDAAQIDMQEFFDFVNVPWKTPPVPPLQNLNLGCNYTNLH